MHSSIGLEDILRILIENRADVNAVLFDNSSSVYVAASAGNISNAFNLQFKIFSFFENNQYVQVRSKNRCRMRARALVNSKKCPEKLFPMNSSLKVSNQIFAIFSQSISCFSEQTVRNFSLLLSVKKLLKLSPFT